MCVRVSCSSHVTRVWDKPSRTITVPADLAAEVAIAAVRAVLTELGVEQGAAGARCWCGDPISIPDHTAQPQRSEEVHHGA